jgi:endonuclease-3
VKVFALLKKTYPDARCVLSFTRPLELLVSTILAAQCTDERVNRVTPALYRKYRTADDFAKADLATLEKEIRPTGFFRNKAKSVKGCCAKIVSDFAGSVPQTMEELLTLPGVGRKTANVVLSECFDSPGIVVDTHFRRVTQRIGLTRNDDPDKIERDLDKLIPQRDRNAFSHVITFHGRRICVARKPKCENCPINRMCDCYATARKTSS